MSAERIKDVLKDVEGFGYGKNQANFGYHHFIEMEESSEQSVQCVVFLHIGSIHRSHEFDVHWNDLFDFLDDKNTIFANYLIDCDTMLGDVKMQENWPIDIENLRVGLLKEVQNLITKRILEYENVLLELSEYVEHAENRESRLENHGFCQVK